MKTNKVTKRIKEFLNSIGIKALNLVKSSEMQMATVLLMGILASSLMIFHYTLDNARADVATPVIQKQIIEVQPAMADDSP